MKNPRLYILCGLSFAGKTTLAKEMVKVLAIQRVAIDDINTERGIWNDEIGLSSEEWEKTYQEAYQRIAMVLSQGESVVDDSANFTKEQRDCLRTIAGRYKAQAGVIFVDVPLAEVQRRWQENRPTLLRADVRDDDFAHVVEQFELPAANENVLRYDGLITPKEWVRLKLLKKDN